VLRDLHAAVYGERPGEEEVYAAEMRRARDGEAVEASLDALEGALAGLPGREELEADAAVFRRHLQDGELPFELRRRLAVQLARLEPIDAYYRAWGREAPYGAGELLRVLYPWEIREAPPAPEDQLELERPEAPYLKPTLPDPPPEGREPGPGWWQVFHWLRPPARPFPSLLQHPEWLSSTQRMTFESLRILGMRYDLDPASLGPAQGRFYLGPGFRGRVGAARLRLVAGNILEPDALHLRWNQEELALRTLGQPTQHRVYKFRAPPEFWIDVELPLESLVEGENQVEVSLRELPGLLHQQGADFFEARLELVPTSAPTPSG